jgi:hypothetical protein
VQKNQFPELNRHIWTVWSHILSIGGDALRHLLLKRKAQVHFFPLYFGDTLQPLFS